MSGRKVHTLTCERIDEDICGHAVYAGDNRCPTCGRRLTLVEAQRNFSSVGRRLYRVVRHDALVLLRAIWVGRA